MSYGFECDDKDTLLAFVYDEIDEGTQAAVARHVESCVACADEVAGLREARGELRHWSPPDSSVGFALVPRSAAVRSISSSSRWSVGAAARELPAWAQAAAALLCLGIGLGVANVQVRSSSEGITVTTGWRQGSNASAAPAAFSDAVASTSRAGATAAPVTAVAATAAPDTRVVEADGAEWRAELAALEQRMRDELRAQRTALRAVAASPAVGTGSSGDDTAVLRDVRALLTTSEERQRQDTLRQLARAEQAWNARRADDLQRITQSFVALQGRTFAVQAGQQQVINQVNQWRRVSMTPPNQ